MLFNACQDDEDVRIGLPVLTTESVTSITDTTAISGGYVSFNGGSDIISKGICWSTSPYPTTASDFTNDGPGVGSFTSQITGLSSNTQYFVRAYATNSAGTAYGNEFMFNTQNLLQLQDTSATGWPTGPWSKKADMPGELRFYPASLAIGNRLYAGMGIDTYMEPLKDFWEWDQATDTWTRKADYPGTAAFPVTGFSIGGKGYFLTGDQGSNQLWEFDPANNSWTQKAAPKDLPARGASAGFSIGNKGYIALGNIRDMDGYYSDLWEWDQATDTWASKADFPGRAGAFVVSFIIQKRVYIGTGLGNLGSTGEFWEWNQETDKWTRLADFPGDPRAAAIGFSILNKGYVGVGYDNGRYFNDFWEWDQENGQWQKLSNFAGPARAYAIGFSIGNKGYAGLGEGNYSIDPSNPGFRDLWEFDPFYSEATGSPVH